MRSEIDRQEIERVRLILNHEDANIREIDFRHILIDASSRWHTLQAELGARKRQFDSEHPPRAIADVSRSNQAAMQLNQMSHDSEPETEPAMRARRRAVCLT